MEVKFFVCKHCGKIIVVVKDSGVPTVCCGEDMVELIPGTTDAAVEKHVPVVNVEGNKVTVSVGSVTHPMLPEHFIEWILLVTDSVRSLRGNTSAQNSRRFRRASSSSGRP